LLCALVMAGLLGVVLVDEVRLDLRHARAVATVQEVRPTKGLGASLVVRYLPRGRQGTTTVQVQQAFYDSDHRVGSTVNIEYDPANPSRARIAGDHDIASVVVVFGIPAAVGWLWWRLRHRRRPGRRG